MYRRSTAMLATALSLLLSAGAAHALDLGDPAPPLTIDEWVKGDAVNMAAGKGKMMYLVEFWAVWCPPCKVSIPRLTEMQNKYKDLVIIGVTVPDNRGNSPSAIRKFCKDLGDEMGYHVAIDKAEATANAYMRAAGAMGIPHAFLVDKEGKVAWTGSPLDPVLDGVLEKVSAGTYDVSRAQVEAEVQARLNSIWQAAQLGQPSIARDGLIDLLKIDPANETALSFMTDLHIEALEDPAALREWAKSFIADNSDNAEALARLAEALSHIDKLSMRLPDLVMEASGMAYEVSDKKDPFAVAMYARAHYEVGLLDKAITLQEQAIAAASGKNDQPYRDVLSFYNRCKELQPTKGISANTATP